MVRLSTCETVSCALVPCAAEAYENRALRDKAEASASLANGLACLRNRTYLLGGATGVLVYQTYIADSSLSKLILSSAALLFACLTAREGVNLYGGALEFQQNFADPNYTITVLEGNGDSLVETVKVFKNGND